MQITLNLSLLNQFLKQKYQGYVWSLENVRERKNKLWKIIFQILDDMENIKEREKCYLKYCTIFLLLSLMMKIGHSFWQLKNKN